MDNRVLWVRNQECDKQLMTEVAEPVLCLRHMEHPRGITSAVAVLPLGTESLCFVPSTNNP